MNNRGTTSLLNTLRWASAGVGVLLLTNAVYKALTKYSLNEKVVLVTGGSRGLGLVLARALASQGARLALCARSADQLELARQELEKQGAEVMAIPVDITDRAQVKAMINDVVRHYGRLDVLVNNAGIIQVGPQEHMEIEDYENAMNINFWAPLYAIHAALPYFRRQGGGKVVNITSIGGKIAVPHLLPYTASKFAAVGLSEGMHAELKRENIQVTTVVPNLMRTGSARNITVKGNHEKEYAWFKVAGASPLFAQEAEVAAQDIIKAIQFGEPEAILSLSGKLAMVVKGIAPGWVGTMMTIANTFLPEPVTGGNIPKKGYEAESTRSRGRTGMLADQAALKNNEM